MREYCLMGMRFLWGNKNVLELDSGDGCMILYIYNVLNDEFYFNQKEEKRNLRIARGIFPDNSKSPFQENSFTAVLKSN